MAEYLERGAIIKRLEVTPILKYGIPTYVRDGVIDLVEKQPTADVVPKAAYDQVAWERDIAIQQLREDYGVSLGEKKHADVVEVKHGRWELVTIKYYPGQTVRVGYCQKCNEERPVDNFCPNCGARMDGEG